MFICVVVRRQLSVLSSDLGFWGIRHEACTVSVCLCPLWQLTGPK